ncbi:hypothetical protein [Microbaculum sp. FT89]|uniref:hypothetical protein n=1 Tax=Microbaculum sp. FT89 TaxID=3447298 RepID=UPI003F52E328
MPTDIFIKRSGSLEVQHRTLETLDLAALQKELDKAFGAGSLYLEDENEPLSPGRHIDAPTIFVHHSHCKRIEVTVRYAGRNFEHKFGPGTTLKTIKRRTEKRLDIDAADAAELSLQIAGTNDRPDEATHVGSVADPTTCSVVFDLIPSDRING